MNSELPRREREKLAQREEMLAAATRLFSERGYANVSMHEIAHAAEFAIGTLYKFFRSKEDLYAALVREGAQKFINLLVKEIDEPDKEVEKLRNYVRTKARFFHDNAPMIRIYFAETLGSKFGNIGRLNPETRELHNALREKLAIIFESGMKGRRFKKIGDPYHLAVALENITNAFLFLWLDEPETYPLPDDPDTILNILFKGLLCER